MERDSSGKVTRKVCIGNFFRAPCELIPVFAGQVLSDFGFQLAVIGVDGGPEGGFGRTALSQSFENPLQITHAVGVADVLNRREGLFIGHRGLSAGELHKTTFQGVEWNLTLCPEELSQK